MTKRILLAMARLLASLPLNFIYLIACLVPKDRKLWLFSAWNGRRYSDNPKYIYKHLLKNPSGIHAVWVTKDIQLYAEMQSRNLPVVYALSIDGICHQLRAGVVVFTHTVEWEFNSPFVGHQVKRVQTWHGMPMKKIGFDDSKMKNFRLKMNLMPVLLPFRDDFRFDLVVAGSEADKSIYETAFKVDARAIHVTGYPRNDAIITSLTKRRFGEGVKIIYMPTFRGPAGSEFQLLRTTGFDYDKADFQLKEMGIDLYIKLHPVQVFSNSDIEAINRTSNIHAIFNIDDIYEEIGTYDLLITDFSGIYFDFLITGKPIIMAPFDLDEYLENDRELYYHYSDVCPDQPCFTWDAVFSRIKMLTSGEEENNTRYFELQSQFHKYLDATSSERVVSVIKQLPGIG